MQHRSLQQGNADTPADTPADTHDHSHDHSHLTYGLPVDEVCRRLRRAADNLGNNHRTLAFYLADMEDRRLCEVLPHRDALHYAEAQLEMDQRRAREYIQTGRTLRDLVFLDHAFRNGEISWRKVTALLPVIQRDTQTAWVEFAKGHVIRDIKEEVGRCKPGDVPGEGGDYGLIHARVLFQARLDDVVHAMLERVRMMLSDDPVKLLTDEELLATLLRQVLDGPPTRTQEKSVPRKERNHEEIPAEVRQHVLRRDGHRCQNCHCQFDVEVHHIQFRRLGGNNDASNLLVLCGKCHAAVHRGFLRISGNPESERVRFTGPDGKPVDRVAPDPRGVRTPSMDHVGEGPAPRYGSGPLHSGNTAFSGITALRWDRSRRTYAVGREPGQVLVRRSSIPT